MVYFVTFLLSAFLFRLGAFLKQPALRLVCEFLSLCVVCYLAALRSDDLGTDTLLYVKPVFQDAIRFDSYERLLALHDIDPLYLLLNHIVQWFVADFFWFKFVLSFLTFLPVYYVSRQFGTLSWFLIWIYLALFYLSTFNFARQSIAVSITLLFYWHILNKRYYLSFVCLLLATLLHKTALVSLLSVGIYYIQTFKNSRLKMFFNLSTVVVAVFSLYFLQDVVSSVVAGGEDRYQYYLENDDMIGVSLLQIVFRITIVVLLFKGTLTGVFQKQLGGLYLMISILSLVFFLSGTVLPNAHRIAYYFDILSVISLGTIFLGEDVSGLRCRVGHRYYLGKLSFSKAVFFVLVCTVFYFTNIKGRSAKHPGAFYPYKTMYNRYKSYY